MSQKEYTIDAEKGLPDAEIYYKDVNKSTFILEEWFPASVTLLVFSFCFCVTLFLAIRIYFVDNFIIKNYILSKSFLYDLTWPLIVIFIGSMWDERKEYNLIKEKPYASISNEKLTLNFGKNSFLWDHIHSVNLEGERRLIVMFKENGRCEKGTVDLKWLSRKRDFIKSLENNCVTQNIHYRESEITAFSRFRLLLEFSLGRS